MLNWNTMKNIFKFILPAVILVFFSFAFLQADLVLAQAGGGTGGGGIPNPLTGIDSFEGLIYAIIDGIVIPIGFVIVVIAIIYTGFLFVMARGNSDKLQEAKNAFVWTAIGAVVLLGSWAIAYAIEGTVIQITDY